MTEEVKEGNEEVLDVEHQEQEQVQTELLTLEEAMAKINDQNKEITKVKALNTEVINSRNMFKKQVRTFENDHKTNSDTKLVEQGEYKELYEASIAEKNTLMDQLRTNSLDNALKAALSNAETTSINTVIKLVDKDLIEYDDTGMVSSDSVTKAINVLRESDPILFVKEVNTENIPPVKRAVEGEVIGGLQQELDSARTTADIIKIMKSHNLSS